ncbi:MAG: hypothetical protein KJ600_01420 [Nanoarchaeota archaeon]|nr:hypothetical protein [Nanoarchaeota archaeon]MBU1103200.1 hypothetical protein [Nanoarchaeota archaeon]
MKISIKNLGEFAENFLAFLDRERIKSNADLERKLGTTFHLGDSKDFVSIMLRQPSCGRSAYAVSYTNPGTGIAIELRINKQEGYSQVNLKSSQRIGGYSPFGSDVLGNLIQIKRLAHFDFSSVVKELADLRAS